MNSGYREEIFDDKEIAVRICSNSHYRIFLKESSRNAYRAVLVKTLLGQRRRAELRGITGYPYALAPLEGRFYFILLIERKEIKMKKILKSSLALTLVLIMILSLASCFNTVDKSGLWENATYRRDMEFGRGEKTVKVKVEVEELSVTFTINTDAETLGEALMEHNLIEGEMGSYGLYIKKVNGMTADYDIDRTYWGFFKDGEYMLSGVDQTAINDGDNYELVLSK